jgi:recombinational DNA repair protein RecR
MINNGETNMSDKPFYCAACDLITGTPECPECKTPTRPMKQIKMVQGEELIAMFKSRITKPTE